MVRSSILICVGMFTAAPSCAHAAAFDVFQEFREVGFETTGRKLFLFARVDSSGVACIGQIVYGTTSFNSKFNLFSTRTEIVPAPGTAAFLAGGCSSGAGVGVTEQ
ncbi:MAG: hypothetical protein AAGB51_10655 [Planctomycetota bacterium]